MADTSKLAISFGTIYAGSAENMTKALLFGGLFL